MKKEIKELLNEIILIISSMEITDDYSEIKLEKMSNELGVSVGAVASRILDLKKEKVCKVIDNYIKLISKNKEKNDAKIMSFVREYNHIAITDLSDILEELEDNEYLSNKGKEFVNSFWKLFVEDLREEL